jgi:hypothetical protein
VTDNKVRLAASYEIFRQYLARHPIVGNEEMGWRRRGAIRIDAAIVPQVKKGEKVPLDHPAFDATVRRRVRLTQEKKFYKTPGQLDLMLGSPMIITDNAAVDDGVRQGIANGSRATLVDVVLRPEAVVRIQAIPGCGGGVHRVSSADVEALVFRHDLERLRDKQLYDKLPKGCFKVEPVTFGHMITRGGQTHKVQLTSFRCAPASVLTGHKWQGQTTDKLLVGDFGQYKTGKDGWAYVVLSRAKTSSGIYLLQPLARYAKQFKKRKDVIAEYERLAGLTAETKRMIKRVAAGDLLPGGASRMCHGRPAPAAARSGVKRGPEPAVDTTPVKGRSSNRAKTAADVQPDPASGDAGVGYIGLGRAHGSKRHAEAAVYTTPVKGRAPNPARRSDVVRPGQLFGAERQSIETALRFVVDLLHGDGEFVNSDALRTSLLFDARARQALGIDGNANTLEGQRALISNSAPCSAQDLLRHLHDRCPSLFPRVSFVLGTQRQCNNCKLYNTEQHVPMHNLFVGVPDQTASLDEFVSAQYREPVATVCAWRCPSCSQSIGSQVTTRVMCSSEMYHYAASVMNVPSAPEVLEVHTTRYLRARTTNNPNELLLPNERNLRFREEGWEPVVFPGCTYDLYSAVLHHPGAVGHFTAVGRAAVLDDDGTLSWQWLEHDSARTGSVDIHGDRVETRVSVLFYRLRPRSMTTLPSPCIIANRRRLGLEWHHNNCYVNAVVTALAYAHFDPSEIH